MKMKYIILSILVIANLVALSQTLPDSLVPVLEKKSAAEKVIYLNKLAEKLERFNSVTSAELAKISLEIARKNGNRKGELTALLSLGKSLKFSGRHADALKFITDALHIYEAAGLKEGMAYCFSEAGTLNKDLGKTNVAIENYTKSITFYSEQKDNKNLYLVTSNLATVYFKMHNYQKAAETYKKAYDIIDPSNNQQEKMISLNQIGASYANWGNYNEALKYLEQAKKIAETNNYKNYIISIQKNIDDLKSNIANKDKAITTYDKEILSENENTLNSIKMENLAVKQANLKTMEEIEKLSFENQAKELKLHVMQAKFERKTLENELKTERIKLLDAKNKLAKTEILKKQESLQNQKYIIIIIASFLVLVLIMLVFLYRLYKQKKKINLLLSHQNIEIQQQKEEIQSQAEELMVVNKELEKLSIVAKETINAVLIADSEGRIEWLNPGAVKMFGESIKQIIGSYYKDASRSPSPEKYLDECFKEKKSTHYETFGDYPSGRIYTQTSLTPVFDDNGNISKFVIVDTDITEIKNAKNIVEAQNKKILDSITFAKLIQDAIFPSEEMLRHLFPHSFMLFKPRDIVSGDFFWLHTESSRKIFAVADCTGHGVPGAFMSMIGNTLLNQIIKHEKIFSPEKILFQLNNDINNLLNQSGQSHDAGMDMSVCCINEDTNEILLGLAGHCAYIVADNEIREIEGSIFSIGG